MKTHNHLFGEICSFANLHRAWRLAERGKRMQGPPGAFRTNAEREIIRLREELMSGSYQPGPYQEIHITRPKARMISAAPFRDRVVHHALCAVVMPLFERKMVDDLYSNRAGKGTHAAIRRCQEHARSFRYVLKCDVRKFFPSMDHEILRGTVRRTIRCQGALWLLDTIIAASNAQEPVCQVFPGDDLVHAAARRVGLPIGNLTSQWFGGIYLSDFDHWVKQTLRCPGYVRYVDDFLLFSDDKAQLKDWRAAVRERLMMAHRLRLHEDKSRTCRTQDGVSFLGQRVWPWQRRILRENAASARRRLVWHVRQHKAGFLTREELMQRWMSWRGHALQADAETLVENIKRRLVYELGTAG